MGNDWVGNPIVPSYWAMVGWVGNRYNPGKPCADKSFFFGKKKLREVMTS